MKIDVTIYQLADSNLIGSQTKRDLQDLMHHVKDVCGDCDPWEKIDELEDVARKMGIEVM